MPKPKSKPKPKPKEVLTESFSNMANSFSSYLTTKSTVAQPVVQPQLKHHTMWAHFDQMISKLDDESVEDLNIDIMKVIGDALKAHRKKPASLPMDN